MSQIDLLTGKETRPELRPRQRFVLELLREHPDGLHADEIGAEIHAGRGRHHTDVRCPYCTTEAHGVLRSKALAPLVVCRRKSRLWQLRKPDTTSDAQNAPTVADPCVAPDDWDGWIRSLPTCSNTTETP